MDEEYFKARRMCANAARGSWSQGEHSLCWSRAKNPLVKLQAWTCPTVY